MCVGLPRPRVLPRDTRRPPVILLFETIDEAKIWIKKPSYVVGFHGWTRRKLRKQRALNRVVRSRTQVGAEPSQGPPRPAETH